MLLPKIWTQKQKIGVFRCFGGISVFQWFVGPVKMYVAIRSQMSSIVDLIRAELSELFALEFAKIVESDFV